MKPIYLTFLRFAALLLSCAAANGQTGYWQYVRAESYIKPYPAGTVYPDTYTGGEGALSVTVTDTVSPGTILGVSFFWSRPPVSMISGTPIYWPVSARIDHNIENGRNMGMHFNAEMYPYGSVSNLATADPWASWKFFALDPDHTMAVGTVVTDNAALWKPPGKVPGSSAADANGLAAVLLQVQDSNSSTFLWNYVYRWVPGSIGSCGGTCTLASPGQTIGVNGGPGSVAITATSTWDVISSDSWIQINSPKTGTGNSSITFTASPNTDGLRNSTIIIGGQPYVVSQDGTGAPITSSQTGLDLHRPKLVVTDTSGNTSTLQPAPGKNDGTDDGSPNAGKDSGVFGQSSGGWQTHNFGKESPVYVMNSTCNDSTGYAYLQFSLATLPTQNIASAKVQVYAGSTVVNNLAANPTDPVFAARRVTSSWDKSKMTWSSGQPTYDSTVIDSQTLSGVAGNKSPVNAWLTYDITNLYKGWASGATPNYGLRFSHENGQCMGGWLGTFATSNDQPSAQTGSTCTYSLSLTAASVPATSSGSTFTVNASAATCAWTASPDAAWLHVMSGTSGNGSGAVTYSVDSNTGNSRQGSITVSGGGQSMTFTVSQAGGGGSTGSTSTCAGTCSIGSPGQPVSATGGPAIVTVTSTSAWTVATPTDNWIHLTSPASNTGNATVSFTVDANTGAPRSSTVSVANQPYTIYQNGTPTGTTAGCAYLIQSNTTQNIPNTGTISGLIQVITAQNCAWTSTATTWITLKSGTSSTGNGSVAYTVPQNDTGNARSGAILIAGQYVAINQAGGTVAPPLGTPVISAGGVVNTASYAPGGPPNGRLAQGSFFSIYGSTVGPDTPVQATSYPLPTSLGGVSVQIAQGSNMYSAPLVFVYKSQINAILPSNVPMGSAQVTITYNGLTSQPATITVARTSFGVFFQHVNGSDLAIAQNVKTATDYPLNLPDTPAKPTQIVIFWGTGMGPITGADNTAPGASAGDMASVPVTITVGGVAAQRLYAGRQADTAGVDNIYFTVPAGVPFGCQVPVVITAGGVAANTTNIAITADGSPCR